MRSTEADVEMNLYPAVCPHTIRRAPMRMVWEELTLLHWRYPLDEVQRLVPENLTVETFDGSAWVGLVPFQMKVDVPVLPTLKRWLHFPETNVRTYVRDATGRPGVWFFSLEASSLPAVITARTTYRLPYFWSDMAITHGGHAPTVRYRSRRRFPGPRGAKSDIEIGIGRSFGPLEADDLDRFLTSRWAMYASSRRSTSHTKMFHESWPLHHGTVLRCDDELIAAAGFTQPTDDPIVHYSPAVNVRCGWPERVDEEDSPILGE